MEKKSSMDLRLMMRLLWASRYHNPPKKSKKRSRRPANGGTTAQHD
jgi:hypothetical protein